MANVNSYFTCRSCGENQSLDNFHTDRSKPNGHAYRCKSCETLRGQRNRKRWKEENMKIIAEAKAKGCAVCGETDKVVLQFHHIEPLRQGGNQRKNSTLVVKRISDYIPNASSRVLLRELAKCTVLCANDHLRLHYSLSQPPAQKNPPKY